MRNLNHGFAGGQNIVRNEHVLAVDFLAHVLVGDNGVAAVDDAIEEQEYRQYVANLDDYELDEGDEGLIDGVISTNLTYRTPELQAAPWFIEADMSKYISYIIATLNHDRSLSKLLSPYDRVHNLMNRYKQEQEQG